MGENVLYYGDNLDVLRRYVKDETVDLVYLDPPFNSNQDYNVLFGERNGHRAAAQIKAFEDTWTWDEGAARAYQETVEAGSKPSEAMQAFRRLLPESDMLAYLSMMAPRLIELRRVLKPTGSLYLHCDPTASHYLKILMDSVFEPKEFRNEIIWKRTSAHGNPRRWGPVHDQILFYSKSEAYRWNAITQDYDQSYLDAKYRQSDERGVYRLSDLTAAGVRHGHSGGPWRGYDPNSTGRHWAVPAEVISQLATPDERSNMTTQDKLDLLDKNAFIYWTPRGKQGGAGFPQWKRYLGAGAFIQDVITDIPPINSQAKERLGYPTQKPQALLDRIIKANTNEGDTVLDPFCGCGTSVAAAQALKRRWIGIDITHLAIGLIKKRLLDAYGPEISKTYRVIGEPVSVPDAERLAAEDPYQFQWWALGLVGARPAQGKKGADKGVDGRLFFHDDKSGETKQIVFSVKAGGLKPEYVRELRGVVDREKAVIGVLISFEELTKPMRAEAASAGFYSSNWGEHPRIQLRTVAELLDGKGIDYPPTRADVTFKKAPRATYDEPAERELPLQMVAETSKHKPSGRKRGEKK
jgi:site-specific DNA-methyltransferase (adenine-specific)